MNLCLRCIYNDLQCLIKIKNNLDLLIVLVDHLLKINKEFKGLWRLEIQTTFTEMN